MNWTPPQYGQQPPAAPAPGTPYPPQGPPPGAPGPYTPPGAPQGPPPGAPPPGYGPPAYPPQGAPPPGYGAPQAPPPAPYGAPFPAPYGAPAAPPPGQYGGPPPGQYGGAPVGFGAPPPALGGPVRFAPNVTSLDNMNDPDLPPGSHTVVGTGEGGSAAQGKMFRVELRVEKSSNPACVGQVGNYKVWLERAGLQGGASAHAQAASKDFALFAVPASGRQLKDTDLVTSNNLVGELANNMTIEGRPLAAIRLGCDVTMRPKKKKPGEFYAHVVFHVLPPGH